MEQEIKVGNKYLTYNRNGICEVVGILGKIVFVVQHSRYNENHPWSKGTTVEATINPWFSECEMIVEFPEHKKLENKKEKVIEKVTNLLKDIL